MDGKLDAKETRRYAALIEDLTALQGVVCFECQARLCNHEALMSVALGHKDAPRCAACLAKSLRQEQSKARDRVYLYLQGRGCMRETWAWCNLQEGFAKDAMPRCLWPDGVKTAVPMMDGSSAMEAGPPKSDAEWNAGDLGCGELVLELRARLKALNPGEVLKLTALDLGAPEDLPAWCRLTGHTLAGAVHPVYWIRRKKEN